MPPRPRPPLPFVTVALAATGALLAPTASAAVDLLEPAAGTETRATAEALTAGTATAQRLVLGPARVRDVDWFLARSAPRRVVAVRVEHLGEVDRRPLELRARGAGPARDALVADRAVVTVRVRADAAGRVRVRLRCVATPGCDAGGAIPYRVRVAPRRDT